MFRVLCAAALLAMSAMAAQALSLQQIQSMCRQGDRSSCVLLSQIAAERAYTPPPPPSYYRGAEPLFVPMGSVWQYRQPVHCQTLGVHTICN